MMNVRPGCPECEKPMNFVVAKLTDEEDPQPEDVKSGWHCLNCGIFRPSEMVAEVDVETLDLDVEEAVRVTSSAAIFIPDEWVLEDKTEEVLETLKDVKPEE